MYRNYGGMISYQKAFEIPLPPEPVRDTGFRKLPVKIIREFCIYQ
ncbi:MAG: hypothetical protein SOT60_08785 [Bilifractor sp.]|nr:hypothetical protein [Bilifractor sp.]